MPVTISRDREFTELLQRNLAERFKNRRRKDDLVVHVSDILPSGCLRRQYYGRKYPELDPLTNETVHHFIRGEASEYCITRLANIEAAQVPINSDVGVQGHPDIYISKQQRGQQQPQDQLGQDNNKDKDNDDNDNLIDKDKEAVIVELKDNSGGDRLDSTHHTFRSYLNQLLYYLVITDVEKGIISIRYNTKQLDWIKRDNEGDHYVRPFNGRDVGIESWLVLLPLEDIARDMIKDQMIERKDRFLKALNNKTVEVLPRLRGEAKTVKCKRCPFNSKCFNEDLETLDAINWYVTQDKEDPLKMTGIVKIVTR